MPQIVARHACSSPGSGTCIASRPASGWLVLRVPCQSSWHWLLQGPSLRFQLPSEPNTYVDLVDDEDVTLMFDEWADYVSGGRHSSAKLHIFVDLQQKGGSGRESVNPTPSAAAGRARASVGSDDYSPGALAKAAASPPVSSSGSPGFAGEA